MRRLENKTILVAGCGGIGNELARRYASEGARVVLGDLDGARARAAVDEIVRAGGTATGTRLDGADENSITDAVALACGHYGGLDGLHVNFASMSDDFGNEGEPGVVEMNLDKFDLTMRVNVRGFVLCTRAALPQIIARGGGAIIYTISAVAYWPETTRVAYAMSKGAILPLMRHVAMRHGKDGVRANCIAPGIIVHERWPEVTPAIEAWALSVNHIKRIGRPADIAATSALLMSDEGAFITGQAINVDGGQTMRA
jgi:NAD(P)-dependent dehydrogenase (short-subunit alcohol dehydrogenase family)